MSQNHAAAFWRRPPVQRRIADAEAAFQRGDFSPAELLAALSERVEQMPDIVSRTYVRLGNPAVSQTPVEQQGALAGIPLSIKDLFDIEGEVTCAGSQVRASTPVASTDAVSVARLRQVGALLTGRSNMTEFAFSGLGLNPHYGTPPNPFDQSLITGGSTSGGAASVAFGLALGALGSDTGGSLRIPAAFCGLVGFKPSQASVPREGAYPLSSSLDCVGPIAASVDCCARLWSVLAAQPMPSLPAEPRPLRMAIPAGPLMQDLQPEVAGQFAQACDWLRQQGCELVERPFEAVDEVFGINQAGGLVGAEAIALHKQQLEQQAEQYDPFVRERLNAAVEVPAWAYLQRLAPRQALQQQFARECQDLDAVLLPTVPILPPRIEALEQDSAAFHAANRMALRNTSVFNYLDSCAVSVPFKAQGMDLPIGLMLVTPQGTDSRALQYAAILEAFCGRYNNGCD